MEIVSPRELTISRHTTGFYSLDWAVGSQVTGEIGFPGNAIIEIYGLEGVGKSTLAYQLSAILAGKRSVALADLEGHVDEAWLRQVMERASGYVGTLYELPIDDKKLKAGKLMHEDILDELVATLANPAFGAGILDSVGAVRPIAEADGSISDAFVGQRARVMAKTCRAAVWALNRARPNDSDSAWLFIINHIQSVIGGYGYQTIGGVTIRFLAELRLRLRVTERLTDGSFIVSGKVEKNSYGRNKTDFQLFYLNGYGIHRGLTALIDCVAFGLASRKTVVKLGNESMGRIGTLIKKAQKGDQDAFRPFEEALHGEHSSD